MIKVLVSRKNAIGDIVMAIPVLGRLLIDNRYDLTFETAEENFGLMQYLMPLLKLKRTVVEPHEDFRAVEEGYDILVNLNRTILHNCLCCQYKNFEGIDLDQHILYAFIAAMRGLPVPDHLSPSDYINKKKYPTNKVLIFARGSAQNRRLGDNIIKKLEKICDNKQIFIDPKYSDRAKLAEEINNAKFVMSVDTGPLYLAEALSTKWFGLYTNNNGVSRAKYYKYGTYIQSNAKCSPCHNHAKLNDICIPDPIKGFDCTHGFDVNFLINKIKENI
jgi:hypothetical protein